MEGSLDVRAVALCNQLRVISKRLFDCIDSPLVWFVVN